MMCFSENSNSPPIVVVHLILNIDYGGAEKLVIDLATEVENDLFAPRVVCLDAIKGNTERLDRTKIPYDLIQRKQGKFDWKIVVALVQYFKKHKVRIVHAHDLSCLLYSVCAGILTRVTVVMTEHSRHYLDTRWLRRFEKYVLSLGTKRFIEVSPLLAHEAKIKDHILAKKVSVIENGVDMDIFSIAKGDIFRKELGISKDLILLGMVGRLEEIKGPMLLLHAFSELVKVSSKVFLVYVGRGTQKKCLLDEVARLGLHELVFFAGVRSDIPNVMAALDLLVIPSHSEGLPFAMLEAMAAGCPVVATAVGQIPDILVDGENGWLVPPGNEKALVDKLAYVVSRLEEAKVIGTAGQALIAERYSKGEMIKAYEKLYLEIVGHNKTQPAQL